MGLEEEYQRKRIGLELTIAREALADDDLASAERHYQQVLTLDAANAEARAGLIQLWLKQASQARYKRTARRYYRRVLVLDPHNYVARARLSAQASPLSSARLWGLGLLLALGLVSAVLAGLWFADAITTPPIICDAVEGVCTPTPTAAPAPMVQPTYTPFPTPTPLPPTPTPTATPQPLPYETLLRGCEDPSSDFAFAVAQTSPVSVTRTSPGSAPITETVTFVITNTGRCSLVEGVVVDTASRQEIALVRVPGTALETVLSQNGTATLSYDWPNLEAGLHTLQLYLKVRTIDGIYYPIDSAFVLTIDLDMQLDRDGDGIPDSADCCPDHPCGLPWGQCQAMRGCPDRDRDGFPDRNDRNCPALTVDCCPDHPGLADFNGCPDADGDGFPEQHGSTCAFVWDQCPDSDMENSRRTNDPEHPGCGICCRDEHDICYEEEKCTDPSPGEEPVCTSGDSYDCNHREVCEPCP